MKTYVKLDTSIFYELMQIYRIDEKMKETAQTTFQRAEMCYDHIQKLYGVDWSNCNLLEVGCGQTLAYTLSFAQRNFVTAIDMELPLDPPYIANSMKLYKNSGLFRLSKTLAATFLGKRKIYERNLTELTQNDEYTYNIFAMDAKNLNFDDNSFDGAFSFSVFEHIDDPLKALQEIKRVLRPGGIFYLDLFLYTAPHGDHDHRVLMGKEIPPWKHLRDSMKRYRTYPCYVNQIRMSEWNAMLKEVFRHVQFVKLDDEIRKNSRYLTRNIEKELMDYSRDELLTNTYIAVAMK